MLLWLIATAAICLLLGVILTLWVEWHLFSQPVRAHRPGDTHSPLDGQQPDSLCPIELPKELLTELERLASRHTTTQPADGAANNSDEALLAVNLLIQFFFRELRSQGPVRRFLHQRINQEMEEALTRGAVSKIIKGLKIYDIETGSRAPTIQRVGVHGVGLDEDKQQMEAVHFDLDVDYSGGLGIAIDVALAYGKSAFLSAKVSHLKGQVRLSFSRRPYSHWSLAFSSAPQLCVDVTSRVQGRSFSHVTSLVASQIHKWIQRKHTLPTSRMRHRPFFSLPDQLLLPGSLPSAAAAPIRRGSLEVTVMEVTRLNPLLQAEGLYCTMALDQSAWLSAVPSETEGRIVLDVRVIRRRHQSLGIQCQPPSSTDSTPAEEAREWNSSTATINGVSITEVEAGSAAEEAGLKTGDVILQVDEAAVRTADDVLRVVAKSKELFVIIRIDRQLPPRRRASTVGMIRFDSMTPSPTFDNLDERSLAEETGLFLLPLGISNKPVGVDIKRTATHSFDKMVRIGDTIKFLVTNGQRFLNLSVWLTGVPVVEEAGPAKSSSGLTSKSASTSASPSKTTVAKSNLSNLFKKHSPMHQADPAKDASKEAANSVNAVKELKEMPIGHVNIYLPEVASDCHLNTQGHHISTYQLYPADVKTSLGRQSALSQQLGFDPRLCYGDVVLSFVYRPDKPGENLPSPDDDSDASDSHLLPGSSSPMLPFTPLASPHPPPLSLNSPGAELARPSVDIIINDSKQLHEFALTQFIHVRLCDFCRKKIWLREALQCRSCGLVCHKKCIKRFPDRKWCGSDNFFSGNSDAAKSDAEDSNPFVAADEDADELVELELAVERLQSREHSESLIRLAKESGKELYGHLSISQRHSKISSMLQRLEAATELETVRHYELAAKLHEQSSKPPPANDAADQPQPAMMTADDKKRLLKELEACESRRQALVLLLLRYSSGLQHVEDAELQMKQLDVKDL